MLALKASLPLAMISSFASSALMTAAALIGLRRGKDRHPDAVGPVGLFEHEADPDRDVLGLEHDCARLPAFHIGAQPLIDFGFRGAGRDGADFHATSGKFNP